MASTTQTVEVLVIGAGVGGISASKTYLELSPTTDLLIVDRNETIGGVWAAEHCYDGLKTNNLKGTYEFTDFPLDEKYGVEEKHHIPGHTLHRYFSDFSDKFDLTRRIKLNTKAISAEKTEKGWRVITQSLSESGLTEFTYICEKLIVSTGLASQPNPIRVPGQESFGKPIFHHKQLTKEAPELIKNPDVKSITIFGGSKTAYDCIHLFASQGKKVEWVIRESGAGPVWMTPAYVYMGPLLCHLEKLTTTRFLTWFSPCIWGDYDGFSYIRSFLHRTALGRSLVHNFWEKLRWDVVEGNGYRKDPTLAGLEPKESMFWTARVGILNYPTNIHEYISSGQVTIHRKDYTTLGPNGTVSFTDGSTLQTDALIAITGWQLKPSLQFLPKGIEARLGIPSADYAKEDIQFYNDLDLRADAEIFRQFPYLKQGPPRTSIPQAVTPFRLYRGVAPPVLTSEGDRSLVFLKMVASTSNMIVAETQALWSYAYLTGRLPIDESKVCWQTALLSRFGMHRYPCGFGAWYPEFVFDSIPYADMLLADLGINNKRKKGLKREVLEGYSIHDYKGIVGEWAKGKQARPVLNV